MAFSLQGKRAVVTAASKGLGRAVALQLARLGARVAICARSGDALRATADEIELAGGNPVFYAQVDLMDREAISRFIDAAAEAMGGLDILVNNTGGPKPGGFSELSDEDYIQAFQLLFLSNVRATRSALPYLKQSSAGSIVNILSVSVKQPLSNLLLSNSVRMAIVGLAKTLADELAPFGIRVNNVCPGSILTDRIHQLVQDDAARNQIDYEVALARRAVSIPLGRLGRPEELAGVVAFLASDAASFVTGVTLQVDGGLIRSMF